MSIFARWPARSALRWTAAAVLGLLCVARPAWPEPVGGLPEPSPTVSETSGGVRYELDRLQENGQTLLVFKSDAPSRPAGDAPLALQAQVLDRLLARQAAARPLPTHVQVRLGQPREALITALQGHLSVPGADWDLQRGRARRGASGAAIQNALNEVVTASPLPAVFARHGFRLRLGDVARIELGHPPSAPSSLLPVNVGEMAFFADRGQ